MSQKDEIMNRSIAVTVATQKRDYCKSAMLFYVLDGTVAFEYENQTTKLKESDIFVLNRGLQYEYKGSDNLMMASLEMIGKAFESVCDGVRIYVKCNSSIEENEHDTEIRTILRQMLLNKLFADEDDSKYSYLIFEYHALYYKLLETVVAYFLEGNSRCSQMGKSENKDTQRLEEIEKYLNIHYMEMITLEDVSAELFLSKGYLSKYFTRTFGTTFSSYLKELRLKHAMSDLLYTETPITQIALDNGFSGSSFFNRVFKEKYKKNPSEIRSEFHRKRNNIQKNEDTAMIRQRLNRLLETEEGIIVSGVSGRNYCFSVTDRKPIEQCWNSLINIGSAADILRTDIQSHILILSKYTKFKYARFWAPFSEEMLLDVNSNRNNYNFLRLDQTIDSLLENGLKPFMVFEPKLERINENLDSVIIKAQHETVIYEIRSWRRIISAMFAHIVEKYGIEEMEQWKFELPYGVYHLKDRALVNGYMELFMTVVDLLKEYTDKRLVGGPALPPSEWEMTGEILSQIKKYCYKPDFISMISFAYEVSEEAHTYSYRSPDEDYLMKDVKKFRKLLDEHGFEETPIYITEWNQTIADRNFINDSCYKAAYIVKNLIEINQDVPMIGYFSGTDLRTEYFDSKDLLQGGNGLISRDGIFKPAGFAFELMNGLGKYQIGRGKNFLITTDNRNQYFMIAHNKRKLGYYYYKTPENLIEKEKMSRFCEDSETLEQEIELDNMENGEYQIRIHKVNAHHGSILDLWKELDYSDSLSRKDIMYLQRICEPHLLFSKVKVTKKQMRIKISMEANEIALIEVKRIMK